METHSRSSSFSESHTSGERLPISAALRLQRAMETHAALQMRSSQHPMSISSSSPQVDIEPTENDDTTTDPKLSTKLRSVSLDDLVMQLRSLWHGKQDQNRERDDENYSHSLKTALKKIGAREKDQLVIYLLEQQETLRTQRTDVAMLGEKIAAQLLHQQHELRQTYREQITQLEKQLHNALHCNPQVVTLQAKVEELEENNRQNEQKLRFAVQKLQRSRKRERELKMMNDPLWD